MVSKTEARELARKYVSSMEMKTGLELVIKDNETIEKSFGWVFFYDSKDFVETKDPKFIIAGNAPIIIDRKSGAIYETGTARSVDFYIEQFERAND